MVHVDNNLIPVLVLDSGNYQALGIMRSLGRLGIPVYTANPDQQGSAFLSRYCTRNFVCNISEYTERSVRDLLDIGTKIGRSSILIPTTDGSAIFVADHADVLRERFVFPNQNPSLVNSLCRKKEMHYLARNFGVPTPEAVFPQCREDILSFLESANFPIMLKAILDLPPKRSGKSKFIVHTKRELLERYDEMEDPKEPNLMLQEYIPGAEDSGWIFNGYFNEFSDCLVGFTGKKIRQWPVYYGMTSMGICLRNEMIEKISKEFMKVIGYRGIVDIDYRYDGRDGRYKVLDINPRIGANFRLFVADNGMDVARALYFDMTRQPVSSRFAPDGRKWFAENLDLASSFIYWLDRTLSLKQWLDSYRGVREAAYFALDDPLPFLHMFVRLIGRLFSRLGRRVFTQGTIGPLYGERSRL